MKNFSKSNPSLASILQNRAEIKESQIAFIQQSFPENHLVETSLSYAQLDTHARAIAAKLQRMNLQGERALIAYPQSLEFINAFFGCLYARVVAVPVPLPDPSGHQRVASRFNAVIDDCTPKAILTTSDYKEHITSLLPHDSSINIITTDDIDTSQSTNWTNPKIYPADIAFLQYTSGSIGEPKGAIISHGNLIYNLKMVTEVFPFDEKSVLVFWIPMTHDLGLMAFILRTIYFGSKCVFMSPIDFLRKPVRWLQAISDHQAHTSESPNFGYDLCCRKITSEQRKSLDLSSWQMAVNAAEPVRQETMTRFVEEFGPYGFRLEAFNPCYGLAEAVLMVTSNKYPFRPRIVWINQDKLSHGIVETTLPNTSNSLPIVSCGKSWLEEDILIVDPDTWEISLPNQIGEIWVSGPHISPGYWNRPDENEITFNQQLASPSVNSSKAGYLRTGDLGFMLDEQLFITGRLKDLIIIRGVNYYPTDLEYTVSKAHPAMRPIGAAFSMPGTPEEQIVVIHEVHKQALKEYKPEEIFLHIQDAISREHNLNLHAIQLVQPGSIPRTTSGKIRRKACRKAFENGELNVLVSWDSKSGDAHPPETYDDKPWPHDSLALVNKGRPALLTHLRRLIARLLRRNQEEIDPYMPITSLGIDSLSRTELLLLLETDFTIDLEFRDLSNSNLTIDDLVDLVINKITLQTEAHQQQPKLHQKREQIALNFYQQDILNQGYNNLEKHVIVVIMRAPQELDESALVIALKTLEKHHDAFQMRFTLSDNEPKIHLDETGPGIEFSSVDYSDLPKEEWANTRDQLLEQLHERIDLEYGPLAHLCYLDRGKDETGLLILFAHHFIMDALSAAIFRSHLQRAYLQAIQGDQINLPAMTPLSTWQEALHNLGQSENFLHELPYWTEIFAQTRENPVTEQLVPLAKSIQLETRLGTSDTVSFLETYPSAQAQHDACLTAFCQAWFKLTGDNTLFIDLENHGRALPKLEKFDLANTIGCFMYHFPILVNNNSNQPATLLEQVKRVVASTPSAGLGYNFLRWKNKITLEQREQLIFNRPKIKMVYQQRLFDFYRSDSLFPILQTWVPNTYISPGEPTIYAIRYAARLHEEQLILDALFNTSDYSTDFIQSLLGETKKQLREQLRKE